jgi:ABC-2 type transport system permease protein
MRQSVHAEWTKLRTVPSTAWTALAVVGFTVALTALATASVDTSGCPPPQAGCDEDTTLLSLSGVYLGQVAVVVLAVQAVSAEYESMMIRTTLMANPRRGGVLMAKAAVVTATVLGAGLLGVIGALLAGRAILPGNGFTAANGYPPLSLTDEPTFRAATGTVLYFGLVGLLSLGVAAAVRHTAGAITTVLSMLYLPLILVLLLPSLTEHTRDMILKYAPMTAGLAVQATVERADSVPIGPWAGLGVLAAYAAGSVILGYALLRTRDA